jgi:hypothetical protein
MVLLLKLLELVSVYRRAGDGKGRNSSETGEGGERALVYGSEQTARLRASIVSNPLLSTSSGAQAGRILQTRTICYEV